MSKLTGDEGSANGRLEIFGEIVLDPEFSESILKQKNESRGIIQHAMKLCTESLKASSGKSSLKVDINSNRLSMRLKWAHGLDAADEIERGLQAISQSLNYLLSESIKFAISNGLDAFFPKVKEISVKRA